MGIKNTEVLEAMYQVPRHLFVEEALASRAWENTALPIGYGQTISQPYIVARMVQAILRDDRVPLRRVLEIGTGCGYQSVIISRFCEQVYTIDRIGAMVSRARERFYSLRYNNIRAMCGDGSGGWEQYAPYDAILVSAAAPVVSHSLLEQLDESGRLVAPVGENGVAQRLMCFTRTARTWREEYLEMVSFVPLLGGVQA